MIYSAADIGVTIDYETSEHGATLQRQDKGRRVDYLVDGEPVTHPFEVEVLPAGYYRMIELPNQALSGEKSPAPPYYF